MNAKLLLVFGIVIVSGLTFAISAILSNNLREIDYDSIIYSNLPSMPDNFIQIRRDVMTNAYPDLCQLGEEYYLQPDFYPTWERDKALFYTNHDYSRWGVHGYGSYPGEQGISIRNIGEGESFTICTFFKPSWGIETYQGVRLVAMENEYFDVKLDPSTMLLLPTYPYFNDDWVKKIKVEVTAKENVPQGEYKLGFNVARPNNDIEKEFTWKVLELETMNDSKFINECKKDEEDCLNNYMLRQNKYVSGGQWEVGVDTFTLIVQVE